MTDKGRQFFDSLKIPIVLPETYAVGNYLQVSDPDDLKQFIIELFYLYMMCNQTSTKSSAITLIFESASLEVLGLLLTSLNKYNFVNVK